METTAMLNKISVGRYVRHEGQGLFIYNIKFFKRIGDSVCYWSYCMHMNRTYGKLYTMVFVLSFTDGRYRMYQINLTLTQIPWKINVQTQRIEF
jgi:hypothetical protein